MTIPSKESAVSPVVGVMLMLVVTIIIAAVVSSFAGGMGSAEKKTLQATLSATTNIGDGIKGTYVSTAAGYTFPSGYTCDNNYILFEHKGGDSFSLNDISVQFEMDGGNKMTFTQSDLPTTTSGFTCRKSPSTAHYFNKIGSTKSDALISPGDKFTLNFDANYYRSEYDLTMLTLLKSGATNGFGFIPNTRVQYLISDRSTGKVIQTGTVIAKV